jgi:AcrR family transcriptional regulator
MSNSDTPPTTAPKRRKSRDGGYARGEETRSRIVLAALDVFGTYGYGAATTRMVADAAGVNLPALQYYFEGKEGVYLACADHIAQRLEERLKPATDRIAETLAHEDAPRRQVLETLLAFLDGFAELFLGEHELEKWVLFIIREQAQPTKAFDVIFDRVMRHVANTCATLVGRLLDQARDDPRTLIRTNAILGQVIFFRTAREAALRVMGWQHFDGKHLALVKATLREHVTAAVGGVRPARSGGKK